MASTTYNAYPTSGMARRLATARRTYANLGEL